MLLIITEILFLLFAVRSILFWVNLWQLKEYRLDRLFVHLKDTRQGKSVVFSKELLLLSVCFVGYFLTIFFDWTQQVYPYIVLLLFFCFFVLSVREVLQRRIKRPIITLKALGVCVLSFLIICIAITVPLTDSFFWLICIAILLPFLVSLVVFLFAFPTEVYTDIYIQKAKRNRKILKKLVVVAVSGSYGKSSTKEVIAHILSKKFNVVKTSLSNNTPLAIAKTMLHKVHDETNIFIAELGAYKKGEIAALSEIVGPTISVTTAVSDQHLALYGSMQDVIASEMELLNRTPRNALALLNADSDGVKELFEKIKNKAVLWYTTKKNSPKPPDTFFAFDIIPTVNGVNWKCRYKKDIIPFHSPLLGEHTVANILPAVILGLRFNLSIGQIQHAVRSLRPLPKTMQKVTTALFGVTCIDDSFNASPESVSAGVAYLKLFAKRKILVLSPLIELGEMGKRRHFEIGQQLAGIDTVLLTNTNFYEEIKEGIKSKNGNTELLTGSYAYLAARLKKMCVSGDAVVFEGKEAGIVLKYV